MSNLPLSLLMAGLAGAVSLACAQYSEPPERSNPPPIQEAFSNEPYYEGTIAPIQGGSDAAESCPLEEDNSVASSGEGPSFLIVSPRHGRVLEAGDVTVAIDVTGFKLVNNPGLALKAGEGRILFYLDPAKVPLEPDSTAGSGPGTYDTDETTHTFRDVPPGCHRFAVQLIDNNGTPLVEPKVANVAVTVRP